MTPSYQAARHDESCVSWCRTYALWSFAGCIVERKVYPCVYETSAHAVGDSLEMYKRMKSLLYKNFDKDFL